MSIRFLKYNEIDFIKWDSCISKSLNSSSFAYSWYLDLMSGAWEALVEDDYLKVMPIIYDLKFNYYIMNHPNLINYLGVFSPTIITQEDMNRFFEAIPTKYKIIEIDINKYNALSSKNISVEKNSIFAIDLVSPYNKIIKNYSHEVQIILNKFKAENFYITSGIMPSVFVDFLKQVNYSNHENNYNLIRQLLSLSQARKFSQISCIYNSKNTLIAVAYFIFSNNEVNLLIFAKQNGEFANELIILLLDKFIQENSEKDLTLNVISKNFKHTDLFLRNLGFKEYFYQTIYIDRIPKIFRLFYKRRNKF